MAKYKEFYKGYTITEGHTKTKTIYLVDGCLIFLSVEEAKDFCDKFPNKSELAEMVNAL
ncbi:MAG: hypothetical protein IKB02_05645 [Clostridia bacterium]|nr:hypothetical protein [Clostridia bacterium]